jgi:hypothetical protein
LSSAKDFFNFDLFPISREECLPAFMPIDVPAPRGPIFVFGEYFLRKFYTVFDRDQNLLGFSLANHDKTIDNKNFKIATPYDDNHDINEYGYDELKNNSDSENIGKINLDESLLNEFSLSRDENIHKNKNYIEP